MSDILVFITATINCGNTPFVKRSDPIVRKQEYLRGLRSWLPASCDADILFCENSAADLTDFRDAAARFGRTDSVRFLSFSGNDGAERWGKGYGEIDMLKHAFSEFPEINEYRYILKASGRYQCHNSAKVVASISEMSVDIICDIHNYLTWADTITAAFAPQVAVEHLIPYQGELDDNKGVFLEHLMARCVHRTIISGCTWAPLPCEPLIFGISGTTNDPALSFYTRAKLAVKRKISAWIYRC